VKSHRISKVNHENLKVLKFIRNFWNFMRILKE
jgi:hypothetical protein